jgi:hypothetical protein
VGAFPAVVAARVVASESDSAPADPTRRGPAARERDKSKAACSTEYQKNEFDRNIA